MKTRARQLKQTVSGPQVDAHSEFLILPDGKILAHNITSETARLLSELNPRDRAMRRRANSNPISKHEFPG
jgi:hypothetical protein